MPYQTANAHKLYMNASTKHKFIILSVPKTGSTSLRKSFWKYSDIHSTQNTKNPQWVDEFGKPIHDHVKFNELHNHFSNLDEYYTVAFVRNPWSRIVSYFEYIRRCSIEHKKKIETGEIHKIAEYRKNFGALTKKVMDSCDYKFPKFVRTIESHRWWLRPCYDWVCNKTNTEIGVDFIGKMETIQQDFNKLCDKFKLPKKTLPTTNKTNHTHYTEYYNKATRDIIAKNFAKDIEHFGYTFDD